MQDIHEPSAEELAALPRIIVLTGPTGVGKTALSLALAQALDAEIVSADSVQIYRELDIGSAKASAAERALVPHHLLDVFDPDEEHNAGDYAALASRCIADIHQRGKQALVVGGTSFYIRALVHGLFEAPPPDPALRAQHREEADRLGTPALHARLATIDPELAERVHPNDLVRISRGLEIWAQTGRTLSALHREHRFQAPNFNALKLVLIRPRDELHARINARVDHMIEAGFVEECRAVFARYPRDTKVLQSLGYRQMAPHILDGAPLDLCVEDTKSQTRRYAKQQIGWMRTEPGARWVRAPVLDAEGHVPQELVRDCAAFLRSGTIGALAWASADPYDP